MKRIVCFFMLVASANAYSVRTTTTSDETESTTTTTSHAQTIPVVVHHDATPRLPQPPRQKPTPPPSAKTSEYDKLTKNYRCQYFGYCD